MAEKLKWIDINEKLVKGIEEANKLTNTDFVKILKHIQVAKNPLRDLSDLENSLTLDKAILQFVVQCLTLLFKESQRVVLKPSELQRQLTECLKLETEKAEEFVKVWTEETRNKFGNFENRSKLTNVTWELNLESGSTFSSNVTKPEARIQLELSNIANDKVEDIVTLENLDEDALMQIYNTLELIQKKVDAILS